MSVKDFNAALGDEKQRELWLKRFLPALIVIVIYFVFISNILTGKTNQAEKDYRQLVSQGISDVALPGLEQSRSSVQSEVDVLKKKDAEVQAGLAEKAGFLYDKSDINTVIDQIGALLQKHQLRIIEEQHVNDRKVADLPHSFSDVKRWLTDMLNNGDTVHVHRVKIVGSYLNMYNALQDMVRNKVDAIPLFLDMKNPTDTESKEVGVKIWVLELWI